MRLVESEREVKASKKDDICERRVATGKLYFKRKKGKQLCPALFLLVQTHNCRSNVPEL